MKDYKFIVTINKFRPEARDNIVATLQKYYGFGKFWTWENGIESEMVHPIPGEEIIPYEVNSLVDHIRQLNAYPDPERRIYCGITIQTFPVLDSEQESLKRLQEYRY